MPSPVNKVLDKILEHISDNNFAKAIQIYEQQKPSIGLKHYYPIARAYHILGSYSEATNILYLYVRKQYPESYEVHMLLLKASFLADSLDICRFALNKLEALVSQNNSKFTVYQKKSIQQCRNILNWKNNTDPNPDARRTLGQEFMNIYKFKASVLYEEAFPVFLVSKRWYDSWKKYVFIEEGYDRAPLKPLSQFQLIDHPQNIFYDQNPQKEYTNRYIFECVEYELLPKKCWEFLRERFGGYITITRYNITVLEKPSETITEVYLTRIPVALQNQPDKVLALQVCRKQPWSTVLKKLKGIWGEGVLFKVSKSTKTAVSKNAILQEEDLSGYKVYHYRLTPPTSKTQQQLISQPKIRKAESSESTVTSLSECENCKSTNNLKYCQCKLVKYCGMECLEQDRLRHKSLCDRKRMQQDNIAELSNKFGLGGNQQIRGNMGMCGLRNLGNTCYMNAGIQCLSNTQQITEYFLTNDFLRDLNTNNPLGSGGYLACCYSKIIREMWTGSDSEVSPWELKKAISRVATQFSGYGQHDSHQLISTLLDGLHEDTNLVKVKQVIPDDDGAQKRTDQENSKLSEYRYGLRNKSRISDLVVGQYKSRVSCPKCKRVSINFDPFMAVNLPIPQMAEVSIFFVPEKYGEIPYSIVLSISPNETVGDVAKKLSSKFHVPANQLVFKQITRKFTVGTEYKFDMKATSLRTAGYVFCYLLKGPSQGASIVYSFDYFQLVGSKRETAPFPRFYAVERQLSDSQITDMVSRGLQNYVPSKGISKTNIRNIFDIERTRQLNRFNVIIKAKDLGLTQVRPVKAEREEKLQEVNLRDCINEFTRQEKLDKDNSWYCNRCKEFVEANKQMEVYKANKILVLGFKRFNKGRKLSTKVNFPVRELDMSDFIKSNSKDRRKLVYELYAISNHFGTMYGGHYTAYCKNFMNNKWYEFNDSRVSKISEEEVVSSAAYVLFYRLKQ